MGLTHLEKNVVEKQREMVVPQLGGHHCIAMGGLRLEKTATECKTLYGMFKQTSAFGIVVDKEKSYADDTESLCLPVANTSQGWYICRN